MRDTASQLADGLKFLRLMQRGLGLLAAGDLDLQPVIGFRQLTRAFGHL